MKHIYLRQLFPDIHVHEPNLMIQSGISIIMLRDWRLIRRIVSDALSAE